MDRSKTKQFCTRCFTFPKREEQNYILSFFFAEVPLAPPKIFAIDVGVHTVSVMWETQPNVTYMLQALNGSNEVSSKYCTNVTADNTTTCTLNDLAEDNLYVVRVNASFEGYSAVEQVYVHTKVKGVRQNNKGTYPMQTKPKRKNKQTNRQDRQTNKQSYRHTDRHIRE